MGSTINEHLKLIQQRLDSLLSTTNQDLFLTHQTSQPGDYDIQNLDYAISPIRHLIDLGGKRWRALALLLTGGCFQLDRTILLDFACLLELTHTGSLIIDDIEDDSPLRRGQPSSHIVYGIDLSINAGNYAYFLATHIIDNASISSQQRYESFSSWAKALRCLHIGQGLDIAWHKKPDFWPTIPQYYTMCKMKTGALSYFAGEAVGILASLKKSESERLGESWRQVGSAFQILDDKKNLLGGMKGKVVADDLLEGKKSLPLILAVQKDPSFKKLIEECLTKIKELTPSDQQDMMQGILQKLAVLDVFSQATQMAETILKDAADQMQEIIGIQEFGQVQLLLDFLAQEML